MRVTVTIAVCLLFALIIDMPAVLKIGPKQFYRPRINLNFLGKEVNRDLEFKLGLDLQGGTHLVYEADTSKVLVEDRLQAVQATKENIDRRINLLGVSEPLIQTAKVDDNYRLIIELPGVQDVKQAIDTIGQTAQLEFRLPNTATPSSQADFTATDLTGNDLKLAQVQFDSGSGKINTGPSVGLEFSPEGAKKFAKLTKENLGKPLAIFLDNQILTAPIVQTEIGFDLYSVSRFQP